MSNYVTILSLNYICTYIRISLAQQLKLLHDNLKKWYRKLKCTRSFIEETIWSLFPTHPCIGYLSVFHDLSQHGSYISTLKLVSSVQELFEDTNGHLEHILIEGHTGIGKTTLCKEICYQWAENNLFTPDKLVLLLLLQDPMAQKITSEYELAEYFTTSFDFIEPFSEYLISSCGAGVTIVIDSYDQLSEELQENGFIKDLIEKKRLSKAQIIITSNPYVSYNLHYYVDRKVELFELVKNKFIAAALKNFPALLKMLQEHFLEYPEVDMLSCVPINMAIMVYLCCTDKLGTIHLPCDAGSMYKAFCDYVVKINFSFSFHIQQERPGRFFYHEAMWYELDCKARKKLNYFAFASLIKNNLVFLEEDLCNVCRKYPIGYGFLQSTECYRLAHYSYGKTLIFNFLCQGIQQCLAASYVSSCEEDAIVHILLNCLPTTKSSSLFYHMPIEWSVQILKMTEMSEYSSKEIIPEIINDLDESFTLTSYNSHLQYGNSKYFTEQDTLRKELFQSSLINILSSYNDDKLDAGFEDASFDCLYICYSSNTHFDERVEKVLCNMLDSGISSKFSSPTITLINLQDQTHIEETYKYSPFHIFYLFQLFREHLLEDCKNIFLSRNGVIDFYQSLLPHHVISLGIFLSKANNMTIHELHLVGCCIGDYGLYLLHRYLSNCKRYKINVINLHGNNLTSASIIFISILIDSVKPQSLYLSHNKLAGKGIRKLCTAVIRNKVHKLNLVNNGLTVQGIKTLFLTMHVLKELNISHNSISNQGAKKLSQELAYAKTLKCLDVSHCNIGEAGAYELAHALTINSSLEILRINGNAIGHNGAVDIAAALCINNTLKELSLTGDTTIGYSAASEILSSFHMSKTTALIKLCLPKTLCSKSLVTIKYNSIHEDKNKPRSIFFQ